MLYYRKNAQEELIKTFWMPELKIDDFPEIVTPQFTTELSIASLSFVEIQFLQEIDYALSRLSRSSYWMSITLVEKEKKKRLLKVGGEIDYRLGVWAGLLAKQ